MGSGQLWVGTPEMALGELGAERTPAVTSAGAHLPPEGPLQAGRGAPGGRTSAAVSGLIKMQSPGGRGAQLDSSFSESLEKASLTAGEKRAPAPLGSIVKRKASFFGAEAEVHPAVKHLKCKSPRPAAGGRRQRPRQRKCKLLG